MLAVTVLVHPAHVEIAVKAGIDQEAGLGNLMQALVRGLASPGA
ncbi:hypothetical protein [Seohaeicola zhoushanensis]|nr:hypothetical protein [Seohaeicola zhoushanensis]